MFGERPRFVKPGDEPLYPTRNKDGFIEPLLNPNTDTTLMKDNDSQTNFVYNRYHHLPINTQRQKLPVFQYRSHILYALEKYQTLVLVGETGCGKSTQVPQYMREVGHKVCVTQPRVSAALSLSSRVAEEKGCHLGTDVGYATSLHTLKNVDTGIVFLTEGVLLREMFASPLLLQYSCIILDEVHERSQLTDVLLGLLKKIAKKRKNLKIIISSATMDAEFVKNFFNLNIKDKNKKSSSTIMSVQGRMHPIDIYYLEEPTPDYIKATVDTVIKIHENEPLGDVLAFLSSQEDIQIALETLEIYSEENNEKNKYRKTFPSGINAYNMSVLPLYGTLPVYRQIKVFQREEKNCRKIILATNIAETSVTISGVVYVIDCGYHKLPYFDSTTGLESLTLCPISKNNATQRAGRSGRQTRGKCFRLYTEIEYDKLAESVSPEMCRSDLSSILLQLKALGIHNLLRFTFPTPPPAKNLLFGIETLYALNAIDRSGNLTEEIGQKMAELPVKPMYAKILCESGKYGCIDEMLSIITILHVDNIFVKTNTGKDNQALKIVRRNNFEVAEGDLIMYLNIFDSYMRIKSTSKEEKKSLKACKEWCRKMYLNYRVMERATEIRSSLEKILKNNFKMENEMQEDFDLGSAKCERVMKCLITGLFPQAAYLHIDGSYRSIKGAQLYISSDSCLYFMQQPKWVVFANVQNAGEKTNMRDIMVIKKEWLTELAPHYYKET